MFYIEDNEKIVLFDENLETLQNTISFMPQYQGLEIKEVQEGYVIYDFELMTVEEMEEKQTQKEQDKINHLTMTALDFVTCIKKAGVSDEIILQYLQANPSVQLQLTLCQNVYCGVVRQLCPLRISDTVTLTDDMVVSFFKKKHNIT